MIKLFFSLFVSSSFVIAQPNEECKIYNSLLSLISHNENNSYFGYYLEDKFNDYNGEIYHYSNCDSFDNEIEYYKKGLIQKKIFYKADYGIFDYKQIKFQTIYKYDSLDRLISIQENPLGTFKKNKKDSLLQSDITEFKYHKDSVSIYYTNYTLKSINYFFFYRDKIIQFKDLMKILHISKKLENDNENNYIIINDSVKTKKTYHYDVSYYRSIGNVPLLLPLEKETLEYECDYFYKNELIQKIIIQDYVKNQTYQILYLYDEKNRLIKVSLNDVLMNEIEYKEIFEDQHTK